MRWYLIVVVIWMSLISDIGHIFIYLLAIYMASLEKGLISSSHLKRQVCFFFLLLDFMTLLYILNINSLPDLISKYFIPFHRFLFHVVVFFPVQKFNVVPLIFYFVACTFDIMSSCGDKYQDLSLYFLPGVLQIQILYVSL